MFTILEYFQGERPSLFYIGQETNLPSDREGYIISSLQSCLFKHLWKDSDVCGCTTENPHPHNKFTSHIVRMYVLSRFSRVRLFATPRTVARQAPLSMGSSRQEC